MAYFFCQERWTALTQAYGADADALQVEIYGQQPGTSRRAARVFPGDRVYVDGREDLGLLSSIEVPLDDWSEVLDSLNRSDVEVLDSSNSHMRRVLDS